MRRHADELVWRTLSPPIPEIAALVVGIATENPACGYRRIRGGLKHVGHDVARKTIKTIVNDHGIEPAPQRGAKMSWKTFLEAHWPGLAAADVFTSKSWPCAPWSPIWSFVMTLKTRAVEIAGITRSRTGRA